MLLDHEHEISCQELVSRLWDAEAGFDMTGSLDFAGCQVWFSILDLERVRRDLN